jgi:glycine cleavage system H lipoate-binding protein
LAVIACEDGTEYSVKCCVDASLLEVNAQLKTKPNLLHQMPATQGYLALCQPLPNISNPTANLMSLEDYRKLRFPEESSPSASSS